MKIFRSFEDAKVIRNPVVTTGSFDGVHIGHKTILNRLKMLMALIHISSEKKAVVMLDIFNNLNLSPDHKITASFHKKIHGAVNLYDSISIAKIEMARKEISELIY